MKQPDNRDPRVPGFSSELDVILFINIVISRSGWQPSIRSFGEGGHHPKEDLAKYSSKQDMKVAILNHTFIFLAMYWNQI
jgi:hypothetical protein